MLSISIDTKVDINTKSIIVQIVRYASVNYTLTVNKIITSFVIDFIIKSKQFNNFLIQQ